MAAIPLAEQYVLVFSSPYSVDLTQLPAPPRPKPKGKFASKIQRYAVTLVGFAAQIIWAFK